MGVWIPSPTEPGNPNPSDPHSGNLIQGNYIGSYLGYLGRADTGEDLPSPGNAGLVRQGNSRQGVLIGSNNNIVGGSNPQEDNVIGGNGLQGV